MRLVIFSGKNPTPDSLKYYTAAFQLWKTEWEKTYKNEFKIKKKYFSDDFVRQDLWLAIFDNETPVALVSQRRVNIANPLTIEDSWFSYFEQCELDPFIEKGLTNGIVTANLICNPDYRKSKNGGKSALHAVQLSMLSGLDLGFQIKFGCSNNSRSVDKLCSTTGAINITKEKKIYNIDLNTFYWTPEAIIQSLENFERETFKLYEEALILTDDFRRNIDGLIKEAN